MNATWIANLIFYGIALVLATDECRAWRKRKTGRADEIITINRPAPPPAMTKT